MNIKSGFVSIIGKPNAGKSTLLNALLGQKLSITTDKPQTTRKRILGILDEPEYQIIFLDTPGILNPEYLLQQRMMEYVLNSVNDADLILFLLDLEDDPKCFKTFRDETVKKILANPSVKKILVINKIDTAEQNSVQKLITDLKSREEFIDIIPVSALSNFNVLAVREAILDNLPKHPKYFPEDQLTDENERFYVSEIIREKIFEYYRDEIPYSTEVLIADFKEREGRKDYISAEIVVEKETQKPIIIGNKGDALKKLGKISREAIEEFLQREVYLELRVKVRDKWRSNPNMLKQFGYDSGNE